MLFGTRISSNEDHTTRSGGTWVTVALAGALQLSTPSLAHVTRSLQLRRSVSDSDSVSWDTVRPRDGSVSGARIQPHTNRWKISYVTAAETLAATSPTRVAEWCDTVSISSDGGTRVLHRRQTLAQNDGAIMEVIDNWADAGTLAPRRTESHRSKGGVSIREFRGTRITGFESDSAAPGGRRNVDATITMPAFDFFGGMYDDCRCLADHGQNVVRRSARWTPGVERGLVSRATNRDGRARLPVAWADSYRCRILNFSIELVSRPTLHASAGRGQNRVLAKAAARI
jgi:hypothetical protein